MTTYRNMPTPAAPAIRTPEEVARVSDALAPFIAAAKPKPMTLKLAKEITGHTSGLGSPSKMPGFSTGISATLCQVGAKLAKIEGSVCHDCYALKANYQYPSVKLGHARRFAALRNKLWVPAMIRLIGHYTDPDVPYFRIHDSGDMQGIWHVLAWVRIAKALPGINFWCPSKEVAMIQAARAIVGGAWPSNLVIRLSTPMIGKAPNAALSSKGPTSTVNVEGGAQCPAYTQDGECRDCRACWDASVPNVNYPAH